MKPIFKKALPEKKIWVNNKDVVVQLLAEFFYDESFNPMDMSWGEPEDRLNLQRAVDSGDAFPADLVITARVGEVEGTAAMGGFVLGFEEDEESVLKHALQDYHLDQEALEELVKSLNTHFEKLGVAEMVKATLPSALASSAEKPELGTCQACGKKPATELYSVSEEETYELCAECLESEEDSMATGGDSEGPSHELCIVCEKPCVPGEDPYDLDELQRHVHDDCYNSYDNAEEYYEETKRKE